MSRAYSVLAVAALLGCGSQSIDAVSCDPQQCSLESGGKTSGGAAGNGGSSGSAAAGMGGMGVQTLVHRFSFNASPDGIEVVDSVAGRSGALVGATYGEGDAAGTVVLAGKDSNQYVDLPNHLLAGLKDATLEAWVTWSGGSAWQRIFDFGEDETGVDGSRNGVPRSYLFLSCNPKPRVAFKQPPAEGSETIMTGPNPIPTGQLTQLAVVVDETEQRASLFVDGLEVASTRFNGTLLDVYDVNDWLGRSQFLADPGFEGSFTEFRIYGSALSASELAASFAAGPDVTLK